jgi:hypothetical protein
MSFRTRNEEKSYKICKAGYASRIKFLSIVRNDIGFYKNMFFIATP